MIIDSVLIIRQYFHFLFVNVVTINRLSIELKPIDCSIIDIVVIGVSLGLLKDHDDDTAHIIFGAALRGFHRLFLILRIVLRWGPGAGQTAFRPFRLMIKALYSDRDPLIMNLYIGFILYLVASYVLYLVESPYNSAQFTSAGASLWWSAENLLAIGAANVYPITTQGKFVASISLFLGYTLFMLPSDIMGAGLALKVDQIESEVRNKSQILTAAELIQ
ncbi:unnamed protein product, partial [Oppiella nova]